jgi:predicted nucleotidyltransferase component of viral defense system
VVNTEQRSLLRRWPDIPECKVEAYTKLEVTAEKLRCVLQRRQCRDFLDLDLLLGEQDLVATADLFRRKATHRGLNPATFAEKFERRVQDYKDNWNEELEQYLSEVPHFDGVERNIRRGLRKAGLI